MKIIKKIFTRAPGQKFEEHENAFVSLSTKIHEVVEITLG